MEITGKIRLIGDTQAFGANNFTKRQIVVDTDEQYSQPIPIDFVKDKTTILDKYKVGDSVKVSINLRGSEHNGKFYPSIQGWRIEKQDAGSAPANNAAVDKPAAIGEEDDNLPF